MPVTGPGQPWSHKGGLYAPAAAGAATGAEFRESSATTLTGNAARFSGVAVTIPAAVQVGDLMLLFVSRESTAVISTPTGWTLVRSDNGSGTTPTATSVFRKIAVSGDTGGAATATTWFDNSAARYALTFLAYSAVDAATPIHVSGATGSASYGVTATAPSVTTTVDGCRIIECFAFTAGEVATQVVTGPATVRANPAGASNYVGHAVCDQPQTSAGASGDLTATPTIYGSWVGTTLAIKPT